MLDLPGHPTLDKLGLIGTCSRLPVRVNAGQLEAEVAALPESAWAGTGAPNAYVDQAMRGAH